MPDSLSLAGMFSLHKEHVDYKLNQNPLEFFIDQLRAQAAQIEDFNKQKSKQIFNASFNVVKLGAAIGLGFPLLGAQSGIDLIKGGIDTADLMKDSYSLAEDAYSVVFSDPKVLQELYKEYNDNFSQFSDFRSFFIAKAKDLVYNSIKSQLKIKVQLAEEVFADIYKRFFEQIVKPYKDGIDMSDSVLQNQISQVDDKDGFIIGLICEGYAEHKNSTVHGRI